MNPRQHTSGSSVHKRSRLTKIGNSRLKTVLYFPALSAIQHNPLVQALALRLQKRGKTGMTSGGAALRKLLPRA
ncbi:MAG: IS110 family transposase [Anaerolineae bacterium]|nr:IS110 family transposase [Anaerolineae bacterium]